ncbi:MAG TPA: hypothetical protein VD860_00790 [Azospirillum sp.]|nr:hypothetical protein [Azospirillum sp.]
MTLAYFIVGGWLVFWLLPFAGGGIVRRACAESPSAARALEITVIAAWVLLVIMAGALSPTGFLS